MVAEELKFGVGVWYKVRKHRSRLIDRLAEDKGTLRGVTLCADLGLLQSMVHDP